MALAGVYWTLATDHVYGERYSNILSNTDDLSYYARLNQSGQVYTNSHNSSNNDIYQTWTQLYSGINNANVLLDNIDAANIPDAAVKNRIKGEAKFLRAYYHFLLVQSWYEVPIRTETVTDINNSSLAATPHAEAIDWKTASTWWMTPNTICLHHTSKRQLFKAYWHASAYGVPDRPPMAARSFMKKRPSMPRLYMTRISTSYIREIFMRSGKTLLPTSMIRNTMKVCGKWNSSVPAWTASLPTHA